MYSDGIRWNETHRYAREHLNKCVGKRLVSLTSCRRRTDLDLEIFEVVEEEA